MSDSDGHYNEAADNSGLEQEPEASTSRVCCAVAIHLLKNNLKCNSNLFILKLFHHKIFMICCSCLAE